MARRTKRRRGIFGRRKSNKKNRQQQRGSANSKQGLTTNGGEYLLNGNDYVGKYHIMDDGRAMTGPKHRGRGFLGLRRKKKRSQYLEPVPVTTPPAPTPTPTTDSTTTTTPTPVKSPTINRPTFVPPPPPPKVDLSGVINQPYKPLKNFGNQYPATDSSVKSAAGTDITSYYTTSKVSGHLGNSLSLTVQPNVINAKVRSELTIDFILLMTHTDGSQVPYTSSQMSGKINQAVAEGNVYYLNSIPVIPVEASEIKPYINKTLFKSEEDYAFNPPSNQIDSFSEILGAIDWTCRKQDVFEEPLPYNDRYDDRATVAARLNLDDVLATANKPPKIRWRRS
jgi:hypothetical protein